jgi:hypothetical protein
LPCARPSLRLQPGIGLCLLSRHVPRNRALSVGSLSHPRPQRTRASLDKAFCEVPAPLSPAEVQAFYAAEDQRYGKLLKDAGIKAD